MATWRITLMMNRADEAGWSETYTLDGPSSIQAAESAALRLCTQRNKGLAQYIAIFGFRCSLLPTSGRRSKPTLLPNFVGGAASGNPANVLPPDVGTVGAQSTLEGQNFGFERRLFRGLPDAWVEWNTQPLQMVLLPAGQLQLNSIVNYLCSGQDSWGWMSRPSAVDNANTAAVDTIAQPIPQTFTLHAPGSSILTAPTGPIIVAGFRAPNSVLNGTYGQGQYSVNVANAIITIRKVVSELSVTGYSGQGGTVRPADYAFTAYQPVTTADWDLVRTRRIGSPFGRTRGRRKIAR